MVKNPFYAGVFGEDYKKPRSSVLEPDIEGYRVPDGRDYRVRSSSTPLTQALSTTEIELINKTKDQLFEFQVHKGDHFQKFVERIRFSDKLTYCSPLELKVLNIGNTFNLKSFRTNLQNARIKFQSIKVKRNFLGSPVFAEISFTDEQSVKAFRKFLEKNEKPTDYFAIDQEQASHNQLENRTIVISGIDRNMSMDFVLKSINKIVPVLEFEYASFHETNDLPETQEVFNALKNMKIEEKHPEMWMDREVIIEERDGDQIRRIPLNEGKAPHQEETELSRLLFDPR